MELVNDANFPKKGSPETGRQFIYLLYPIWSGNAALTKKKKMRQKPFWTGMISKLNGRVVEPGAFNKTIILFGLAGCITL